MQTLLRQPSLSPATVSTMTLILSHPWQRGLSKQKLNGMKEVLQSCQHIALATPLSGRRVVHISYRSLPAHALAMLVFYTLRANKTVFSSIISIYLTWQTALICNYSVLHPNNYVSRSARERTVSKRRYE